MALWKIKEYSVLSKLLGINRHTYRGSGIYARGDLGEVKVKGHLKEKSGKMR